MQPRNRFNSSKDESTDKLNFKKEIVLKYDPRRVKKDVLYKPLFRTFRTILRDHMLTVLKESHNTDAINLPIREQTWLFMHEMKMPDEFLDLKSLHSMMLLLFPRVSHE